MTAAQILNKDLLRTKEERMSFLEKKNIFFQMI